MALEGLNEGIRSVLEAANIDEAILTTVNREDLKDLFPGAADFLQRKQLWDLICKMKGNSDQNANMHMT
ncbi:unnamed protein product [Knipowitschia caucasica]|uniref:Uncharacterized protein n=1 Tax=Knipowitschia caucasica TaxID=637954 RepID=A0AAV2KA42_KNICA